MPTLSDDDRYMLALWLIRAYLLSDEWEADFHIAWIQTQSGLSDEAFAPAAHEAWKSAQGWRSAGRVGEAIALIDEQLTTP
ncbi:hypothetical protein CG716_11065 [Mycolicibacterium sphagni]|uniref:Uncharacterized protein n=1 Tax=Mycolicibacterium sphagni TaxID=1786 RepID=A0A255DLM1_9MYCO|nr:hypothetical protein CG716_11065 [Mycolicibacterium sphagni]